MATNAWSGHGEFEPAIVRVVDGGQYATAAGLFVLNSNTSAVGGNSGTRGIYASGQSLGATPVASRVSVPGYAPISIAVTNVFNPTSNEGVYAALGAQVLFGNDLSITTKTDAAQPALQATAVVAEGIGSGPLANMSSRVTVAGRLAVDTTGAATTPFAVQALDGAEIAVQGGGEMLSAASGIYVRATGAGMVSTAFSSSSATALTLQADGNGVTLEGQTGGNANWASVQLQNATITARDSGVLLRNGNGVGSFVGYMQNQGSITSTASSALAFTGGLGHASVVLRGTDVATTAPAMGGVDTDGIAKGYSVVSDSDAENVLDMTGGSLTGHIATETGAHLWLAVSGTQWVTAGNPAVANSISLTGISGSGTIVMSDIQDRITLEGNTPGLGTGCGDAQLTLVVPEQAAPAASPHTVMLCKNAAAAPNVALQGGSVTLGGYVYSLVTQPADGRVIYNLVRGDPVPVKPPASKDVAPVPALSSWNALLALSGLVGFAGLAGLGGRQRQWWSQ